MCVKSQGKREERKQWGEQKDETNYSHFAFLKENWAFHNQFAKKVSAVTAIMIVYNPLQNAPS